jgi:hypothetical protein
MKCQCDLDAINHVAGRCRVPASYSVLRHGVRLSLCPDCTMPEDQDPRRLDEDEDQRNQEVEGLPCPHCGGRYTEPLEGATWECYDCGRSFEAAQLAFDFAPAGEERP